MYPRSGAVFTAPVSGFLWDSYCIFEKKSEPAYVFQKHLEAAPKTKKRKRYRVFIVKKKQIIS